MNPTLEQFFTTSGTASPNVNVQLRDRVRNLQKIVPYKSKTEDYTIRIGLEGASAYNSDGRLVASIGRLVNLVVSPPYQKQGLATALICEYWKANSSFVPEAIANRNPEGQKAFSKAWTSEIKSLAARLQAAPMQAAKSKTQEV